MTDTTRQALVAGSSWLADRVLSLSLIDPADTELPSWSPGAHLDLFLPSGLIRSYSLYGDPADRSVYRIAVLLEEVGRGGSAEIHRTQLVGRTVTIRGPRQGFPLEPASGYLFIAGGIGITALLPMAYAAAAPHELVYLGKRRSCMAFAAEVENHGGQVIARDERDRLDVAALLGTVPKETLVYCCGPPRLIREVQELGASQGLTVKVEHFGRPDLNSAYIIDPQVAEVEHRALEGGEDDGSVPAAELLPANVDANEFDSDGAFEVELAVTGTTIKVGPGESILAKAREVRQGLSFSCADGYCGSCEAVVLDGIPDHRDSVLSDDERQLNETMMICVGRSRGPRLVLEL